MPTVTITKAPPGFRQLNIGSGAETKSFVVHVPVEDVAAEDVKELKDLAEQLGGWEVSTGDKAAAEAPGAPVKAGEGK